MRGAEHAGVRPPMGSDRTSGGPRLTDRARARLVLAVWIALVIALGALLNLMGRNGSFEEKGFVGVIATLAVLGYGTIGAYLAARLRGNSTGWLMIVVAASGVLGPLTGEWATYAYRTKPGGLPFRELAAWLWNWSFFDIAVAAPIPYLLMLFPTGRLPSGRWRWLPIGLAVTIAAVAVAQMLRPGEVDLGPGISLENPTGIDGFHGVLTGALWVAFITLLIGSLLSLAVLVGRFRRSLGEERQQIRWLAYVATLCAAALLAFVLTGIGIEAGESRPLNDGAAVLLILLLAIGVPVAIGIALLKYRLWELDVVLKKTLIAAVLVALIALVSFIVLLVVGAIIVGPLSDNPGAMLMAGLVQGILLWPLLRLSRRISDRLVYGRRTTPYELLTEFSGHLADTYSSEDVLPRMASILGQGTGAAEVTIWLFVRGELRPTSSWPGNVAPAPTTTLEDLAGASFVVRHQGEELGAITVRMPPNDPMNPAKEKLIRDLASQAGLVLRNVRLIEELRGSRRRIVAAQDEARRRLERNIHDGAQQQLVALLVKQRLLADLVGRDDERARVLAEQLRADTEEALQNLRDLARGIYPPLLADEGLAAALEAQARKAPLPVTVEPDGIGRYTPEIEATVYFCVLEALQNALKYADASSVSMVFLQAERSLTFDVHDDGAGFDLGTAHHGSGLQGMADRLDAIGGALEIRTAPGSGTSVIGRVPLGS